VAAVFEEGVTSACGQWGRHEGCAAVMRAPQHVVDKLQSIAGRMLRRPAAEDEIAA
jgi:hypothetical protein